MSLNSKRNVISSNEEMEDRISKLPDAIIQHILSFMEAEDAVRTALLSKRFARLWTDVPRLYFEESKLKFIGNALHFHTRSNLEKVSLVYCEYDEDEPDQVIEFDRLFRLLSSSSVKDLTLIWEFPELSFFLPQHLYSNSCLQKLTLENCDLNPNGIIEWKSLQTLCLSYTMVSENTINNILSGCPCLELLKLSRCREIHFINLANHFLRKLEIDSFTITGTVQILAPNLHYIVLSGEMDWYKCRVLKATCLIDCFLDFSNDDYHADSPEEDAITMVTSLLEDLSHAEVVTVGHWVILVLSLIEMKGFPCPMSKSVKCLKLNIYLYAEAMAGIGCLLEGLNCLEELFIYKRKPDEDDYTDSELFSMDDMMLWTSEDAKIEFHLNLKTVKIFGFDAGRDLFDDYTDEPIPLFEFLLKIAMFLDNMTVSAYGTKSELEILTRELLGLPRSSPHATIRILELETFDRL